MYLFCLYYFFLIFCSKHSFHWTQNFWNYSELWFFWKKAQEWLRISACRRNGTGIAPNFDIFEAMTKELLGNLTFSSKWLGLFLFLRKWLRNLSQSISGCGDLLRTCAFFRYNYKNFADFWINGTVKLRIQDKNNVSGSSGSKNNKA